MRSSKGLPTDSTDIEIVHGDPLIVSIQHFCLHDGPGTRTVIFFKGCPLRCAWCSNPESWRREVELGHKAHLCIACGSCIEACPRGAIRAPGDWDESRCDLCMRCVDVCPARAMVEFGEHYTVDALLERLRPEYDVYRRSGGGVTFSGGEVTLFAPFASRLARALRDEGVHVTIETCGLFHLGEGAAVEELLAVTDLVLFDIKLFDDEEHRRYCGSGNRRIKENLATLVERARQHQGPAVWPRMPVIPGITDTPSNIAGWAEFTSALGLRELTLVPYHELGSNKRNWIRGVPEAPKLGMLTDAQLDRCRERFEELGLRCHAPGEELLGTQNPGASRASREHE